MAYGDITGYTPLQQPGAYQFHTPNGPITAFGQPAEELRQRVDASNAVAGPPNQSVAPDPGAALSSVAPPVEAVGAGAAAAPAPEGRVGKKEAQEFPEFFPQQAAAADAQDAAKAKESASPEAGAGEHPTGPVALGAVSKSGGQVYLRPGGDPANPSDLVVIDKPHGATKDRMQLTTESHKGGFDPNQEYLDKQNEINLKLQAANEVAYQAASEQAAMEQGARQAEAESLAKQAKEAQDFQQQVDLQTAEKNTAYVNARNDYLTGKVDPDKYMRGNFQAGVGVILGSIQSALTQGRDQTALNLINKRIDQDITEQERRIAVKKDAAGVALQDLERQLGSRDAARNALRSIRLEQAKNQLAIAAGATQDQKLASEYLAASAKLDDQISQLGEDYRQKSLGEVTRNLTFKQGQAASAGGPRALTLDEQAKMLDLEAKKAGVENARNKATGANGKPPKISAKIQTKLAALDAADAELSDYAATHGGQTTINTGFGGTDKSQELGRRATAMAPTIAEATGIPADQVKSNLLVTQGDKALANVEALRRAIQTKRRALTERAAGGSAAEGGGAETEGGEGEGGSE